MRNNITSAVRDLLHARPGIDRQQVREALDHKYSTRQIDTTLDNLVFRKHVKATRRVEGGMQYNLIRSPRSLPASAAPTQRTARQHESLTRLAELEAFQAAAIKAYPDLANIVVTTRARNLVAKFYKSPLIRARLLAGTADDHPAMQAVMEALTNSN